jgi:3-hydroxyacyl-CoA dehydrogenase
LICKPHVDASMRAALSPNDAYQTVRRDFPLMETMIKAGYTGRKGLGGFYRLQRNGAEKVKESIDLKRPNSRITSPIAHGSSRPMRRRGASRSWCAQGQGGQYAWQVLSKLLSYAASLVPEISDDIANVDLAMRTGFNWKRGPFEMIDQLGAAWFAEKLTAEKMAVPPLLKLAAEKGGFYKTRTAQLQYLGTDGAYHALKRAAGVLLLSDIKRAGKPILKNGSASLWDIGDGVACLEFHSKMNSIDPDTLDMVKKSVAHVGKSMKALVVHNEADNFSVGANIGLASVRRQHRHVADDRGPDRPGPGRLQGGEVRALPGDRRAERHGLGRRLRDPAALRGRRAHAETYMGLVEVGVGLIPGWGGCKELLLRNQPGPKDPKGPMPPVAAAFETISLAKVAKSAAEAKELKLLRASDGISMNRDRLLFDAKQRALELLAAGYKAPEPKELRLPGPTGRTALQLAVDGFRLQGKALPHDVSGLGCPCRGALGRCHRFHHGGDRGPGAEAGEEGVHGAAAHRPDARPHGTHADHQQAAQELRPPCPLTKPRCARSSSSSTSC